ncbi:MAG: uroporphyrinogen decarboxylase [Spirochaetales bacterium]|nr:uroporphyrinogen decarboxylase [Spirochaetales bacterium]
METNGRDLLLDVLSGKNRERVPWIPYTGVHVASLKGYDAETLLKSSSILTECLLEAFRLYRPDGLPVIFDLQIEAEILGCDLVWDEKAPPSVRTHVLENDKEIRLSLPRKSDGRIPLVLKVMSALKQEIGDQTALYGLVCGPLTLASHLRGMNIFMDMYEDPEYVDRLITFCGDVCRQMSDFYIDAGMDVIAVVDPMVSQISPDTFSRFLTGPFADIFAYIKGKKIFSSFFVCGDATKNVPVMCETKPDCISIDENIDIADAKKICDSYGIVISGNIPLTTVMLLGNQKDNQKYALDTIRKTGLNGFILAPGCDMPFDVPRENIIGITQAVQNFEATWAYLKNYEKEEADLDVELPDYDNLEKPLIEVFTIDSASCAACGYMKAAAFEMKDMFGDSIDVVEYKITLAVNVAKAKKLGIINLPAILINGKLKYSSLIPDRKSFWGEVEKLLR